MQRQNFRSSLHKFHSAVSNPSDVFCGNTGAPGHKCNGVALISFVWKGNVKGKVSSLSKGAEDGGQLWSSNPQGGLV